MKSFPFTAGGYIVHLGRGTLAAVAEEGDTNNPLCSWATEHREPHFGGVDRGAELIARCSSGSGERSVPSSTSWLRSGGDAPSKNDAGVERAAARIVAGPEGQAAWGGLLAANEHRSSVMVAPQPRTPASTRPHHRAIYDLCLRPASPRHLR
jgi:hypothetical protein